MNAAGRVGLLGGSFDPIHRAHLAMGEAALEQFALDCVLFVPCGAPPHKRPEALSPAEHRLAMVELATAGHPRFFPSRLEIDRPGPSYTVDTVEELLVQPEVRAVYLIIGGDSLAQLATWHRYRDLVRLCELLVAKRPGWPAPESVPEGVPRERVHILRLPPMDVSATEIRRRVAAGESISGLVPPAVERYIAEHGLYRS